jgi:hypothetical protein
MSWPTQVRTTAQRKYGVPGERLSIPPARRLGFAANDPRFPVTPRTTVPRVPVRPATPRLPRGIPEHVLDPFRYRNPFLRPALRAFPLGRLADAYDIYMMLKPKEYVIKYPAGIERIAGPFNYPYPYNSAPVGQIGYQWTYGPITNQYITGYEALGHVPYADYWGVWIPNDINSIFGAEHSAWRKLPQYVETGQIVEHGWADAPGRLGEPGVVEIPEPVGFPSPRPTSPEVPYWALPYAPRHPNTEVGSPVNAPAFRSSPRGEPAITTTINPGAGTAVRTNSPTVRTPPGPGVKERKATIKSSMPILHGVLGTITEGADLIRAIHGALPPQFQAKPKRNPNAKGKKDKWKASSPQEKLGALYDHWDKIDIGKAVGNVIKQEAGDRLIGKVNQGISKGNGWYYKKRGTPFGITVGPAL